MTPKLVKDLPKEIQDLYVKRQVEQGNKEDREIIPDRADRNHGGINWDETPEGHEPWAKALYRNDYKWICMANNISPIPRVNVSVEELIECYAKVNNIDSSLIEVK